MKGVERIAILGGVRIPFARHNLNYVTASNQQLALHHRQTGRRCRALISACAVSGLGVTAILESE